MNNSILTEKPCSLQERVYTGDYLFFKFLATGYLRLLIVPGILLNTLCLIVFSRPKLSTKSTTILFLRYLAIFDALSIALKFIRAEVNYQSITNQRTIAFLTTSFCQTIYVCMNTCISIAMWTIVLMSIDKAIAVSYPLKSAIWITCKRASYFWCLISLILFFANLSFIHLSEIRLARNDRTYCGLKEQNDPLVVDILTASILPIALITLANIVIIVVLHRVSRASLDWPALKSLFPDLDDASPKLSSKSSMPTESVHTLKRRTSAQITRMLLAVTMSLILFNMPNTIIFLYRKMHDTRLVLQNRLCPEVRDEDIRSYKVGFYSSVIQDILSDLPHIVNFFLYCLAGRKFRQIFIREIQRLWHGKRSCEPLTEPYWLSNNSILRQVSEKHFSHRQNAAYVLYNRICNQINIAR